MNRVHIWKLVAALVFLTAALFIFNMDVYAQDDPQPGIDPPVEVVSPAPITESDSPAPEQVPAGEGELLPETEPAELLVENSTAESSPPAPMLIDQAGELVSLATVAAAQADPYFTCANDNVDGTVDGICQYFGVGGIQTAIADFTTRMGSGNIFIEDAGLATDYTGAVVVSGIPGLTGLVGVSSISPSPSSLITLSGSINISNQLTGFTLSGLTINGNQAGPLVNFNGNTGFITLNDLVIKNTHASGDALSISSQTGNVNLTEVKADQNGDEGASIDATGNVTVTNSSFDANSGPGALVIVSGGAVTLNGVSASINSAGNGAQIGALKGVTVRNSVFNSNYDGTLGNGEGAGLVIVPGSKGSVLIENSYFSQNQEAGLLILNNGSVTLKNVNATGNQQYGAYVDNCQASPACSNLSSPVTITTANFTGSKYPLTVYSNGNISLSGVTALYASAGHGAELGNDNATSPRTISVKDSDFSYATMAGLYIRTKGAVFLDKVRSNFSATYFGADIVVNGTGGVTLTNLLGESNFSGNSSGIGLSVVTRGPISLKGVSALNNGYENIYLDNTLGLAPITLSSALIQGSLSTDGLRVLSGGGITLNSVESSNNSFGGGAVLDNSLSIIVSNVNITNGSFSSNKGDGLKVDTRGSVVIKGIYASSNTNTNNGVTITTTLGAGNVSVSNGEFISNTNHGLGILTLGTITLSGITSRSNIGFGVDLDNFSSLTPKSVTISSLHVSQNNLRGLNVLSKGLVKITNITANYLPGGTEAVRIDTLGGVSIGTSGTFRNEIDYNFNNGLTILAGGAVTIANTSATGSVNGYGASINNSTGSGGVTLTNSLFNYNKTNGLFVLSTGLISGSGLQASSNQQSGAILNNLTGTGGVTVNGGSTTYPNDFSNNDLHGIKVLTNGTVSLTNITASYNTNGVGSGNGVDITSWLGNITLTNITANGNGDRGVTLYAANGSVSLNGGTTNGNKNYGTYIDNSVATSAKSVTVKNLSSDSTQTYQGLYILSTGNVLLTTLHIENTDLADGIYVNNTYGTAASTITINSPLPKGNNVNSNHGYGLFLLSDGAISISNINATYSYISGIYAANNTGSGSISLANATVTYSRNAGIILQSTGAINLSGVAADYNGVSGGAGWGASLDNTFGSAKITVSNSSFTGNYHGGLYANATQSITATNVTASYNQHDQGLLLSSLSSVSILSSGSGKNTTASNHDQNVQIISGGDVIVQNLTAEYNTLGDGVNINNTSGAGKVVVSGVTVKYSQAYGVYILSNGAVSISNTTSNSNGMGGVNLDNSTGTGTVSVVNLQSVSNSSIGLWVVTNGNTLLDRVNTSSNFNGTQVQILDPVSTLTIQRSQFNSNPNGGFSTDMGGNVTLNNVAASNNTGAGALGLRINNFAGVGTVTVLSTYGANEFNNNGYMGFSVFSKGAFKGSKITASDNAYHGLDINNQSGTGGVMLTGGAFHRNSRSGINLTTSADVLIDAVSVFNNGTGADVPGIYVVNGANITLSNSVVTGNGKEGLYAMSGFPATILIKKTLFFGNNRWSPYDTTPNLTTFNGTLVIVR